MSGPRPSESRCFNENSPRPPVPGEERGGYQGRCQQQQALTISQAQPDAQLQQQQPRRTTSCDANETTTTTTTTKTTTIISTSSGKLAFEPEGSSSCCCCEEDQRNDDDDEEHSRQRHHQHQQSLQPQKQQQPPTSKRINMEVSSCDKAKDEELYRDTVGSSSSSSLACLQWTKSLRTLLEDQRGLDLFNYYLQQEGYDNVLSFWLACEGLMEERNPDKLPTIYKAIYRKFFQRPKLALLSENLRKEVTRRYREGQADKRMFEQAHQEVERLLEETPYPNFLRSDLYLQYVRHCQSAERNSATGRSSLAKHAGDEGVVNECPSSPDELSLSCASSLLPTLHEDSTCEFSQAQQQQLLHQQQQHHHHQHHTTGGSRSSLATTASQNEMRLTKDMLVATQQFRALDVRPKPEAFAGLYLQPGASPYHASVPTKPRAQYCSYNPVSRQDSELQSLSSDARTESDNLSLTDASLSDSASMVRRSSTRKQYAKQYQQMKRSAMMNRDPTLQDNFTPRTQKVTRDQLQPMPPEKFAEKLIEKLKLLQLNMEKGERLDRKLREVDQSISHADSMCDSSSLSSASMHHHHPHHHHYQQQAQMQQQHQQSSSSCVGVNINSSGGGMQSRTMADALCEKLLLEEDSDQAILDQHVSRVWSDLTPSRSPKVASPRPRSPDKCRRQQQQQQHQLQQQQQQQQMMPMHQQQQMSMSGATPRPAVYRSQRKEKDVFSTFSGDSGNVHDFPEAGDLHTAGSMSSLGSHHLPKSKSVPSDYADSLHTQDLYIQSQDPRYRRLDGARSSATKKSLTELTDSGVSVVSDVPPSGFKEQRRMLNWPKQPSSGGKKFSNAPQHPFVGDPGMPLLPQPHTPTQLEEASRRLHEQKYEQNRSRQRGYPGLKQEYEHQQLSATMQPAASASCMQSSQSTLRRGRQDAPNEFTTVVFSFCEEKVPYRIKIPGYNVTLKQFKDVLPKKGSYRYFFKTECEDLDMKVIQEEITDDAEVLPLWEGKIMAQVKALE